MPVHESSVNFDNLIRDLADMYTLDVAEVVIVEVVANALDAKADRILIDYDPVNKVLIIEDNGGGMSSGQFEEYHDFAAGLKTRGTGIGFAGVGAKISFNIADRVITETKSDTFSGGSNWFLHGKKKLLWEDTEVSNLKNRGTYVKIHFNPKSKIPYSSTDDLFKVLKNNYLPLFDISFLKLYEEMGCYSKELRFIINKKFIEPVDIVKDYQLKHDQKVFPKKSGKMYGYGIFGLSDTEYPVAQHIAGVLLCTYGKVIKSDFFGQFPGEISARIFGLIEVPEFVSFLTTSKTDFMRAGHRFRKFEKLYNPLRQEFKQWMERIGIKPTEVSHSTEALRIEKELSKLVDDVPELGTFFGFRTRKSVLIEKKSGALIAEEVNGAEPTYPIDGHRKGNGSFPMDEGDMNGKALMRENEGDKRAEPISRKAKKGPKISFSFLPDKKELAWIDGNNIVINSGHPAYQKLGSNDRAKRIHSLFGISNAILKFKIENGDMDLEFIDRLMTAWGKK